MKYLVLALGAVGLIAIVAGRCVKFMGNGKSMVSDAVLAFARGMDPTSLCGFSPLAAREIRRPLMRP